ncbi:MAG: DUF2784 family protein [Fimbriimonadaceae bacterium]|nr:DUF2784 family protein [Fimbriimonadaceae bacterium]
MLATLNILFWILHTGLVAFNVFGWMWERTRRWNLVTLGLTLGSWVGMGAFKGIGYCLCTDVHSNIRRQMGITDDPPTYVGLLIRKATGFNPSTEFVYWLSAGVFLISLIASVSLNIRDSRRRKAAALRP